MADAMANIDAITVDVGDVMVGDGDAMVGGVMVGDGDAMVGGVVKLVCFFKFVAAFATCT